jgi:hypothetical protein
MKAASNLTKQLHACSQSFKRSTVERGKLLKRKIIKCALPARARGHPSGWVEKKVQISCNQ